MVEFPKDIRMAVAGDEARLYALFVMAHAENGYGDIDEKHVKEVIARGCRGDRCVIALVDGPERVEAAIGFHPVKPWYASEKSENYYHSELLFFVHPLHRRAGHHEKLFTFADWWASETKLPVILDLMPRDDLAAKDRLFARYGERVGAMFLFDGKSEKPDV